MPRWSSIRPAHCIRCVSALLLSGCAASFDSAPSMAAPVGGIAFRGSVHGGAGAGRGVRDLCSRQARPDNHVWIANFIVTQGIAEYDAATRMPLSPSSAFYSGHGQRERASGCGGADGAADCAGDEEWNDWAEAVGAAFAVSVWERQFEV
jgi:hypothetical protein